MRFIFNPFTWCKGQIKQWLAQMGAERLDEIADPEQYNGKEKESLIIEKVIEVYKTRKHYKIITNYKLKAGSYLSGEPVFILPLDITAENLSEVFFESLNHSRLVSESEEDKIWNNRKQLLKKLKEPSFNALYKNSVSCDIIYVENQKITIKPKIYLGLRKGLVTDTERVIELEFSISNYIDIAQVVIDVLC
ncbi:MAG: CdiI family contact-dependent growth inhibition immunity protein [Bacteroidales bacterium]|nr:CdiI family contact-dependent growth inhibition immunity protein [Bacteroidales bacterium]